ncbi:MAG: DUF882 domain-containing protein [Alcaligenaceae bacterium]|nr:DUF882 domain-containing protein [Alcaligenaceae bacterium]
MLLHTPHSRRQFLQNTCKLALAGASLSIAPSVNAAHSKVSKNFFLNLDHTHTHEKLSVTYRLGDQYLNSALNRLNYFLRDHYSGAVGAMDPGLYDILDGIQSTLRVELPYQIISGYRDPHTNERLRTTRGGGVAKKSLHMEGKALDIRMPGVPLDELRDAALSLNVGGVGYYPDSQFIHVDTGRVRSW